LSIAPASVEALQAQLAELRQARDEQQDAHTAAMRLTLSGHATAHS